MELENININHDQDEDFKVMNKLKHPVFVSEPLAESMRKLHEENERLKKENKEMSDVLKRVSDYLEGDKIMHWDEFIVYRKTLKTKVKKILDK